MLNVINGSGLFGRLKRLIATRLERSAFGSAPRRRTDPSGKRVIIHAGFRKTGTTTVQALLDDNIDHLHPHLGVITRTSDPSTDALHRAGRDYAKIPTAASAMAVRHAARRIDARIRRMPQSTILLSEENIIGHYIVAPAGDVFSVAADVLSILEEEFCGHDLAFVFTTRQRDKWLRSSYNQDVKFHKFPGSYDDWMKVQGTCRDIDDGRRLLEDKLRSPVVFMAMETDLSEGRFLGLSLLEMAGVPSKVTAALRQPAPRNASLGGAELEFMREINGLDLPFSITHRIVTVVQNRKDLFSAPVRQGTDRSADRSAPAQPARAMAPAGQSPDQAEHRDGPPK